MNQLFRQIARVSGAKNFGEFAAARNLQKRFDVGENARRFREHRFRCGDAETFVTRRKHENVERLQNIGYVGARAEKMNAVGDFIFAAKGGAFFIIGIGFARTGENKMRVSDAAENIGQSAARCQLVFARRGVKISDHAEKHRILRQTEFGFQFFSARR